MGLSPEDLGLAPDLSRLPREVRNLIRDGNRNGHDGCSDAVVEVCAAMFRADFNVGEIWIVLIDPNNGISKAFFSKVGEQAEANIERVICETYEAVARSEYRDQQRRFDAKDASGFDPSTITNGAYYLHTMHNDEGRFCPRFAPSSTGPPRRGGTDVEKKNQRKEEVVRRSGDRSIPVPGLRPPAKSER